MPYEGTESALRGRVGYVSVYDEEKHRARVRFPELDNLVSYWLPILTTNTKKNHDETPLDVDERVFCVMLGTGLEAGFIVGAFYDEKNKPPVKEKDTRSVIFEDEEKNASEFSYDRKKHFAKISISDGDAEDGELNISVRNLKITDLDTLRIEFTDDTYIKYDVKDHKLIIHNPAREPENLGHIDLSADVVSLNGHKH